MFILNDNFTPFDFVVQVLIDVFKMNMQKARSVMLKAHKTGRAHCGKFSSDVADTKVHAVHSMASVAQVPLRAEKEPER